MLGSLQIPVGRHHNVYRFLAHGNPFPGSEHAAGSIGRSQGQTGIQGSGRPHPRRPYTFITPHLAASPRDPAPTEWDETTG
jgi:hypothetical protein